FVKGDYIAFVDSGRDLNPKQLIDFLKIMSNENTDIVIGSKKHKDSKVHYPFTRRVMSGVYRTMNRILFSLDVKDTQVGLKLFKRKVLNEVMPRIAIKRFAFDLELLVIANKRGFKITEAPITLHYQFQSTINMKAVFWMLWDTAAIFYRDKILHYYD
ncbi:MAG: glycosyltransferase family 2 protein, partial [archaeon]|nr:glycosyltransferase family 2 protein [archaeon]